MVTSKSLKALAGKTVSFGMVTWNVGTGGAPAQVKVEQLAEKELSFGTVSWNVGTGTAPAQAENGIEVAKDAEFNV